MLKNFSFEKLDIEGAVIINPFLCEDERGFFSKSYEKDVFLEAGISTDIQEEFESLSKRGVIRGIHFQTSKPQSKIVKVLSGEIFDVAIDLRKDSKTYGQWRGVYLNDENMKSFYVPPGCAHGFLTISEHALVSYRCTGKYIKEHDAGIKWDDKDLAIEWPLHLVDNITVSERDNDLQSFKEYENVNK